MSVMCCKFRIQSAQTEHEHDRAQQSCPDRVQLFGHDPRISCPDCAPDTIRAFRVRSNLWTPDTVVRTRSAHFESGLHSGHEMRESCPDCASGHEMRGSCPDCALDTICAFRVRSTVLRTRSAHFVSGASVRTQFAHFVSGMQFGRNLRNTCPEQCKQISELIECSPCCVFTCKGLITVDCSFSGTSSSCLTVTCVQLCHCTVLCLPGHKCSFCHHCLFFDFVRSAGPSCHAVGGGQGVLFIVLLHWQSSFFLLHCFRH